MYMGEHMIMKPKCHNYDNCGNDAITLVNGLWLCSECFIKIKKGIEEKQQKDMEGFLIEE